MKSDNISQSRTPPKISEIDKFQGCFRNKKIAQIIFSHALAKKKYLKITRNRTTSFDRIYRRKFPNINEFQVFFVLKI